MKKYIFVSFMFIFVLLMSACSKSKVEKVDLIDVNQVKAFNYQKSESIIKNLKIETFDINIPSWGQVNSFCIYNNTIFYVIDFFNYFDNPEDKNEKNDFEKKYNTQIRSYELKNGDDILLYQYNEKQCVQVTDMQCNGKELVWEEYINDSSWNIKKMSLYNNGVAENIFSYDPEKGKMLSITLTITNDSLFWYDEAGDGDNPIVLYRYDFETQRISIEKSGLSSSSPYEHINIINEIYSTYKKNNGNATIIQIYNLKSKEELNLNVASTVSNPISNGEICVWLKGYDYQDRSSLFIYDISKRTYEKIEILYVFSYGLIGNLLLVNQEDGLYCYDVKNKEYEILIKTDKISYGYTFQGQQNNIYVQKIERGLHIINLIYKE